MFERKYIGEYPWDQHPGYLKAVGPENYTANTDGLKQKAETGVAFRAAQLGTQGSGWTQL